MKEILTIQLPRHMEEKLKDWGKILYLSENTMGISFDSKSKKYKLFLEYLKDLSQKMDFKMEIWKKEYKLTKQEQLNSEYLRLLIDFKFSEYINENTFIFSPVCRTCNERRSLPVRNGLMVINKNDMKNNEIANVPYPPGIIISSRLKNLFEENKITGCSFRPVMDYKTEEVLSDYFEMKLEIGSEGLWEEKMIIEKENECPECNKYKSIALRSPLYLKKYGIEGFNIFITNEVFGGAFSDPDKIPWYAPAVIIDNKTYRLLVEHNIKGYSVAACFVE